jgi:hypothetical protein
VRYSRSSHRPIPTSRSRRRRASCGYRATDDIVVLDADATLEGGDVVPGWSVRVAELFE